VEKAAGEQAGLKGKPTVGPNFGKRTASGPKKGLISRGREQKSLGRGGFGLQSLHLTGKGGKKGKGPCWKVPSRKVEKKRRKANGKLTGGESGGKERVSREKQARES